jgi:type IV pilus assembly protein PilC
MLTRASQMYESEVDYSIEKFLAFFEPVLVVVMGFVVGFVVLSVFLPVYAVVNSMGMN